MTLRSILQELLGSGGSAVREGVRWRRTAGGLLAPGDDGAGRALVAVVAVLAFLAVLAGGAAALVGSLADEWRASVSREATILIRPMLGRDADADVESLLQLARAEPGIAEAEALSRAESERLLEPWLGRGLDLSDLPVPRLIVLRLDPGGRADLDGLSPKIRLAVPGASIDDGAAWLQRLSTAARAVTAGAVAVVALILAATGLAVAFATRGVMAGNRDLVDVLHVMGAGERFIAYQFVRRFGRLGLTGGLIGGVAAALCLVICRWLVGSGLSDPSIQTPDPGFDLVGLALGGALAGAVVAAVAAISAFSSWLAVRRFLRRAS